MTVSRKSGGLLGLVHPVNSLPTYISRQRLKCQPGIRIPWDPCGMGSYVKKFLVQMVYRKLVVVSLPKSTT